MDTARVLAAVVVLALAACSADRGARAPRDSALPDSVPIVAPGEEPDADSLAATLAVFEFAEAGAPLVVPVLGAQPDSAAADRSQSAHLLGSAGPLVFVRLRRWAYTCGMHGFTADSFLVLDLAQRRAAPPLDDSALAALAALYRPDVAVAFKADTADMPVDADSARLTMMLPRLAGGRLSLTYQFTAGTCNACSDDRWSSYTRSVRLAARALPPAIAAQAEIPLEVQSAFRIQRVSPDSGAGWSEVRMPGARRDALARLFGVTAPAGGAEFLVWRALPGGSFETVWLRGSGVEATIVGRRPGVWIAAGGRAWNWKSRTERVATVPCSQQLETPKP